MTMETVIESTVDAHALNSHAVMRSFVDTPSLLAFHSRNTELGMNIERLSGGPYLMISVMAGE